MHKDVEELNRQFVELGLNRGFDATIMNQRIEFIQEELDELMLAMEQHLGGKEVKADMLDALVDIVVVAMGTAYYMGWNFEEAWNRVHEANMSKVAVRGLAINGRDMTFDLEKGVEFKPASLEDLV